MGNGGAKADVIPIYDGDIIDRQIEHKRSFVIFVKDAKYKEAHQEEEHLSDVRGVNVPIYTISFANAKKSPILKQLIERIEDKTKYAARILYIRYTNGKLSDYTNQPLLETGANLRYFMHNSDYAPFERLRFGAKYYEEERKKYKAENKGSGGSYVSSGSESGWQLQMGAGPIGYGSKGFGMSVGPKIGNIGFGYSFGDDDDDDDDDDEY